MREAGSGSLVVMENDSVQGVISESDMVLGCMADSHIPWQCGVRRHMIAQRLTVSSDSQVGDASLLVIDRRLDYLPVVYNGPLTGLLTSESLFGVIDSEIAYAPV